MKKSSSFRQDIGILMTGAAGAQLLAIGATPILTRLFTPEQFGLLAQFIGIATFFVVFSSLSLDMAIVLPEEDDEARRLLFMAIACISICAAGFVLMAGVIGIAKFLPGAPGALFLWLGGVILFGGIYKTLTYWVTRKHRFKVLSISRVFQVLAAVSSQLAFGYLGLTQFGLIWGYLIGTVASCVMMVFLAGPAKIRWKTAERSKEWWISIKKYRDFIFFRTPQNLIVSGGKALIPVYFGAIFGLSSLGSFALANRILVMPLELVGNSVRQAFFPRSVDLARENPAELLRSLLRLTGALTLLGAVPLALLLIGGPYLFRTFFGEEWAEAGNYAAVLMFGAYGQFICNPSETLMPVLGLQKEHLIFQIALMTLLFAAIFIASTGGSARNAIVMYSGVMFGMKLFLLLFVIYKTKQRVTLG